MWWAIGGVVGLIVLAVWVITIVDIFRSHLSRGQTAAWAIIVLVLPLIGSVLYWALRRPSRDEIQHQADAERALRDSARHRSFDSTGLGR